MMRLPKKKLELDTSLEEEELVIETNFTRGLQPEDEELQPPSVHEKLSRKVQDLTRIDNFSRKKIIQTD